MLCEETILWLQFFLMVNIIFNIIFLGFFINDWYKKRKIRKMWEEYKPDPMTLTCYNCVSRNACAYVDDPYNTQGDCLAYK